MKLVGRLKSSCDPLIVTVKEKEYKHLVGKKLSEVKSLLVGNELDVTVKLS